MSWRSSNLVAACLVLAAFALATTANAQSPSPLARFETLGLDTLSVGHVTAYFAPADRVRAEEYATLANEAAVLYERQLGLSFPVHLAVLRPEDWFNPYSGGETEPYGMPWGWVEERVIAVPASLEEGVLIRGSDELANLRRVRFVLLHEYGHLANKAYFHPESPRPYSSVRWFEELFASYWAYTFVRTHDPAWAETAAAMWTVVIESFTPPVLSLDWGWNNTGDLPPNVWVRSYAWYQNLLNLRAAELYDEQGLEILRTMKEHLAWETAGDWTTASLLPRLEEVAPGFEAWADDLEAGDHLESGQE